MTFLTLIGTIGAGLLLLAFAMNQSKRWKNDDLAYDFVNFLGGLILVVYAILLESWPFAILSIVWTFYFARDLINDKQ